MNPIYQLQDMVERDLARNADTIADGIAWNLELLTNDPKAAVTVVDLERMKRLGLVGAEGRLTGYGMGFHNKLKIDGYYGKKAPEIMAISR